MRELDDPQPGDDELLVEGLALGIGGTDREIASGRYGWASPGRDRLVLGHESFGRVLLAPPNRGRYTERGIRGADGYGSTSWTVHPDYAVPMLATRWPPHRPDDIKVG